jgi:hypothetical protein
VNPSRRIGRSRGAHRRWRAYPSELSPTSKEYSGLELVDVSIAVDAVVILPSSSHVATAVSSLRIADWNIDDGAELPM